MPSAGMLKWVGEVLVVGRRAYGFVQLAYGCLETGGGANVDVRGSGGARDTFIILGGAWWTKSVGSEIEVELTRLMAG